MRSSCHQFRSKSHQEKTPFGFKKGVDLLQTNETEDRKNSGRVYQDYFVSDWNTKVNKKDANPNIRLEPIELFEKIDVNNSIHQLNRPNKPNLNFIIPKICDKNQRFHTSQGQQITSKHLQQKLSYEWSIPYGFDTNRSNIIIGDRTYYHYIDCSFGQLIQKIKQLRYDRPSAKWRGIKLTHNNKNI